MIGKPEKDAAICNISQNLAIEAEKKKLKRLFEDIVPKAYHHVRLVFAKESFNGQALARALKKLSVDSLSNLYPHPLYVFFHYSHPPLLERLKAIG